MKATIERAALLKSLGHVQSVVERRNTIPILSNVLIEASAYLGWAVAPLVAGLGVGGLAVALAARPTIENVIGGLILFADKPFRVGDLCRIGETGAIHVEVPVVHACGVAQHHVLQCLSVVCHLLPPDRRYPFCQDKSAGEVTGARPP